MESSKTHREDPWNGAPKIVVRYEPDAGLLFHERLICHAKHDIRADQTEQPVMHNYIMHIYIICIIPCSIGNIFHMMKAPAVGFNTTLLLRSIDKSGMALEPQTHTLWDTCNTTIKKNSLILK